jgi:hypothetical protein
VARALKGDNERMKNELMLIKGKMNELYGEKEGWESEKKNLEEMCASLMVLEGDWSWNQAYHLVLDDEPIYPLLPLDLTWTLPKKNELP